MKLAKNEEIWQFSVNGLGEIVTSCPGTCLETIKGKIDREPGSSAGPQPKTKMEEELKRKVMKRRFWGPERRQLRAQVENAFNTIWQVSNQMRDARMPAGQERDALKWKMFNKLGYMWSSTLINATAEIREEAEAQAPVKRRSAHGEWQRSHRTEDFCPCCNHAYCSCEDLDDSELEIDEEERERRAPIKCGYDTTEAGQIYCCGCENRFHETLPPGVWRLEEMPCDSLAGRPGAESPTAMAEIPVVKRQAARPLIPIDVVEQPQSVWARPVVQPRMPVIAQRNAETLGRVQEAAGESAMAEVGPTAPEDIQDMTEDTAKCEPEGGYVDTGEDDSPSSS